MDAWTASSTSRNHLSGEVLAGGLGIDGQVADGHGEFITAVRGGASRTPWRLTAALLPARSLALDSPQSEAPPPLFAPARPWRLHNVWVALSILIITLSSLG
jgi:hypothetical protein